MSSGYIEQLQDLIAEEVADSMLLLDLHAGISEETRLNFAVDLAVADGYTTALGDAIDHLREHGQAQAAALVQALLDKAKQEGAS